MMKKLLAAIALILGIAGSLQATDYPYFAFATTSGTTTLTADGLQITIADETVHATNGSSSLNIPLSTLTGMFFTSSSSALSIVNNNGTESEPATVDAFTTDGLHVGTYNSVSQAVASLTKGKIYLLRVNGETVKIQLR
jgi:hypothetical protein